MGTETDTEPLHIELGDVWLFRNDDGFLFAVEEKTLEEPHEEIDMMWAKTKGTGATHQMKREQFSNPGEQDGQLIRPEDKDQKVDRSIPDHVVRDWMSPERTTFAIHDVSGCREPMLTWDGAKHLKKELGVAVTIALFSAAATASGPAGVWLMICSNSLTFIDFIEYLDKTSDPSALRPDQWLNVELVNPSDEPARFECEHCRELVEMPDWVGRTVNVSEIDLG